MTKRILLLIALFFGVCLISRAETTSDSPNATWRKKAFGDKLVDAIGKTSSTDKLKAKIIGVYFSAHWCPPCRAFTPKLVQFYNQLKKNKKSSFEIVFISLDNTEKEMSDYMTGSQMPWKALPFSSSLKSALQQQYNVGGIPTLLIFDSKGNLLSRDGRGDVQDLGEKAYQKWKKAAK